eukprot:12254827-Ditylum_brightwellii.AAC.1
MDKTEQDHNDIDCTPYQSLMKQQTTIGWEQINMDDLEQNGAKTKENIVNKCIKKERTTHTG